MAEKSNEVSEPLGCLLWLVVGFVAWVVLSLGDEIIAFLEAWLKAHT